MDRIPKIAMEVTPGAQPPAGYRRPMSCVPAVSRDLTLELSVAETPTLTTDDSTLIAQLVDEIDMNPHRFVERFLTLERAHADLLDRVDGLCAREVL
jgi:hypothetical protein